MRLGFPGGSDSKESASNAGDQGSIPGLGRSPGEGKGYPLQYSDLHCIAHGAAKSQTEKDTYHKKESEIAQPCPTLCDSVDYSIPDSSVHGILQARILEWVAISFSRGSSQPRDRTLVSCMESRCFIL